MLEYKIWETNLIKEIRVDNQMFKENNNDCCGNPSAYCKATYFKKTGRMQLTLAYHDDDDWSGVFWYHPKTIEEFINGFRELRNYINDLDQQVINCSEFFSIYNYPELGIEIEFNW